MKSSILYFSLAATLFASGCSKKDTESSSAVPTQPAVTTQAEVRQSSQPVSSPTLQQELKATQSEITTKAKEITTDAEKKVSAAAASLTSAASVQPEAVLADLDLSVDELKSQVAGFDLEKTTAYATQYKELITNYTDKVSGLSDSAKKLSVGDMFGGKATALKDELAKYTKTLASLKDRYGVYLSKLKDYGVDLSAYGL